jgi:dephospho-CoA kinase
MKKIAITGNMGTGKSIVGSQLLALGYPVLDCDQVVAKLYQTSEVKDLLQAKFAYHVFHSDGQVNHKRLAQVIYTDETYRLWLQKIIWPRVKTEVELWLFGQDCQQQRQVFVLIPLLFEAGWQNDYDEVWLIYSSQTALLERLQLRDHLTLAQAKQRLATQIPDHKKRLLVSKILTNSGIIQDIKDEVKRLVLKKT